MQMNSVYPQEEKSNPPPPYEQAVYYPQAPPIPSLLGMFSTSSTVLQPQAPPVGTYSTSTMVPPPQPYPAGMYQASNMVSQPKAPSVGLYPTSDMVPSYQAPPIGTHMLITTQALMYGDLPIQCICPHCHQTIVTRVEKQTGLVSWLICGGILLLGGWLGCCLIPFCVDSLKDTEHYCPGCAVLLGTRRRM